MIIAICDDDGAFLDEAIALFHSYLQSHHIDAVIERYLNAEQLLARRNESPIDLLVLDIILGPKSGFQVAADLLKMNTVRELAFVTVEPTFMADAFQYRPIGFISKPASPADVSALMERFLFYHRRSDQRFTLETKGQILQIPHKSILFFESRKHHVYVHTESSDQAHRFSEKLDTVEKQLQNPLYLRCHKSYLVNMDWIHHLDRKQMCFSLRDGRIIPISKLNYSKCVDAYLRYRV